MPRRPLPSLRARCQSESDLLSRRQLLWAGMGCVLAGMATPVRVIAALPAERVLKFASIHTGESLSVVYRVGDAYQEDADFRFHQHHVDKRGPL